MPEEKLIECVPNFSEGRDPEVIRQIAAEIEAVEGVELLDVDPGRATHRTVVTFVGTPGPVLEAAFRAIRRASELIDMRQHQGEHPRMGATDVCPLVPVSGITMEETAELARRLGRRVGEELGIPIYLYENAASSPERRNLAAVRAGEYEGLEKKLGDSAWKPDFGPTAFNASAGATAIGARNFLIAYNVNLNTTSTRRANAIAFDVRERGRPKRIGHPLTGEIARGEAGEEIWISGSLEAVKAIGWYIEEYGIAQVSMNLTDVGVTPLHEAFDEVCRRAEARGVRVTGSELVGLVPLSAILDAGRHFLRKQKRSVGVPEAELVKIAVRSLGLDELAPFDPEQKIIEYRLRDPAASPLVQKTVRGFAETTASESPAPGGGSVSALLGSLGAALGTMVANLSAHKRGWDERWEEFSDWAERGQALARELLHLVDEDTAAFDALLAAYRLPKASEEEKSARETAIATAMRRAIEVPLEVMRRSLETMEIAAAMTREGLESSVSDAGVGALAARAAVRGAHLNVRINSAQLDDEPFVSEVMSEAARLAAEAERREAEVLEIVAGRIRS